MQTTEAPRPTLTPARPISGPIIALTGAFSFAAAAGIVAFATFRGGEGKLTDYLIIVGIVAALALVTFAVAVPRNLRSTEGNRPAAAGLVAGVLAALAIVAFWSGALVILGAAAILLAVAGRRRALSGAGGAGIAAAALALAVLAFAGQVVAVVTDSPEGEPTVVTQQARIVAGDDWQTTGFGSLEAGWLTIAFETMEGPADHGLMILRLLGDATYDEALEAFMSDDPEEFLAITEPAGGFVGLRGAGTHRITLRLRPGTYAMLDFGGGPEGPNFMNGMTASFQVAATEEPVGAPPKADGEIVLTEYAVEMPDPVPGPGTYLVRNAGAILHELNIAKAAPGTDLAEEVGRHIESGRGDFEELPGVSPMAPGAEVYVELDLQAGPHLFACFLELPNDPSHAAQGMWTEVTVG